MKRVLDMILRWKVPLIILLVIIMVGTIHYTSTSRLKISLFEGLGRDLLVPFQWVFSRAQRFVLHQVEKVQTLRTLKERNAELEELVLSLQAEVLELRNYKRENEWLREALDFKNERGHDLLVAEVIGRSPSNWESTIILNKGFAHGVEQGMAVVTNEGVVGTVVSVSRLSSTVLLIIDAQSATGGLVQSTGDLVLVEGGQADRETLSARPLSRDTVVEVGDVIVTSGLSTIYPKNIPIGEVVAVEPRQHNLSFAAVVRPFVDFNRLEYVLIVLPQDNGES
ncbi:MAG: rod shape-determining protein MreC [Limnochordia bacterium]|nr:rod shape-determining protein MreC [Bacillota bacterium]